MSILRVGGSLVQASGNIGRVSVGGGGGGALLTSGDFTYLGAFRPPADNGTDIRFAYSNGALSGRRVGGNIQLMMTGANTSGNAADDNLYEFTYPGTQSIAGPWPAATMVRKWLLAPYVNASSVDVRQGNAITAEVRGLQWHDGKLWFSFGHYYTANGEHNRSLGFSVLNDAAGTAEAFGSWRLEDHSQRVRGYILELPEAWATTHTNGVRLAFGSPITAGNSISAWGAWLAVLNALPTTATAVHSADPLSADKLTVAKRLAGHTITNKLARDSYYLCGWNVIYDCGQGSFVNTVSTFSSVDTFLGSAWITTASKEGVLMVGQQVSPTASGTHTWYGPAFPATCCHGQSDPNQSGTGDQTSSLEPVFYIFDPAVLASAASGAITPHAVTPASSFNLRTVFGTNFPAHARTYWSGGCWFDSVSRLLFVSHRASGYEQENDENQNRPVIHVFEVAA